MSWNSFRFAIALLGVVALLTGTDRARAAAEFEIGMQSRIIQADERGGPIDLGLWYPAAPGGNAETIGGNKVFAGVDAHRDAPVPDEYFPLVLLSHGGLRAAPGQGNWLAAALAARGYLVVVVQAPPPAEDPDAALRETWLRPADLSTALASIMQDPAFSSHIDADRIGAIGFLRGATAALELAGARLDPARFAQLCDGAPVGPDCRWFRRLGLDLHSANLEPIGRAFTDGRIRTVVAVDPELGDRFDPTSLSSIAVPVTLINLGTADMRPPGLDAAELGQGIPGAQTTVLPEATPFGAFSLCTPQAAALLEGEDEAVCSDRALPRAAVHRTLVETIDQALNWGFTQSR